MSNKWNYANKFIFINSSLYSNFPNLVIAVFFFLNLSLKLFFFFSSTRKTYYFILYINSLSICLSLKLIALFLPSMFCVWNFISAKKMQKDRVLNVLKMRPRNEFRYLFEIGINDCFFFFLLILEVKLIAASFTCGLRMV